MENLKYTEILQLNKALAGTLSSAPYSISILGNVTINSFKEILEYNCRLHQIEPDIAIGNFDNIVQDSMQVQDRSMVIIFYDMLGITEAAAPYFNALSEQSLSELEQRLCGEIDLVLDNLKAVPSVLFNTFSSAALTPDYTRNDKADRLATALNRHLEARKGKNVTLIYTDKILLQTGIKQGIDFRFYHSSKAPYTVAFLKTYANAILPVLLRNNGKLKKALIFDCDNTLWQGIVGEDGVDGIDMSPASPKGKAYYAVQQLAAMLSEHGVIIGLCSKNNEQDVEEVLQRGDMALKNDHIVCRKVNWQDKATNLRAIAAELNIGIDSLVFVDDSPFEINLIREQLPEVLTFQVPANVTEYAPKLTSLVYQYFNLDSGREDLAKTRMYKEQFEREETKKAFASLEDYLASLEISLTIGRDNKNDLPRVAQLTQKTNQFNLTTKRYTETETAGFMERSDAAIFTIFVKDKFGESGLTGLAIIQQDETQQHTAVIDSLLMSCRIIGRNIEHVFLNYIIESLTRQGIQTIKASYVPTKKNMQVAGFYEAFGFNPEHTGTAGDKHYSLQTASFVPVAYPYIQINEEQA